MSFPKGGVELMSVIASSLTEGTATAPVVSQLFLRPWLSLHPKHHPGMNLPCFPTKERCLIQKCVLSFSPLGAPWALWFGASLTPQGSCPGSQEPMSLWLLWLGSAKSHSHRLSSLLFVPNQKDPSTATERAWRVSPAVTPCLWWLAADGIRDHGITEPENHRLD